MSKKYISDKFVVTGEADGSKFLKGDGTLDSSIYATPIYVDNAITNLIDSAPATLDTLNELAAALGDDPNFATTVTTSIGEKLPLAGGTLTGALIGTSGNFSASLVATGNSNSFGNTTVSALSATSGAFSASVTATGNSNSFGNTIVTGSLNVNGVTTLANTGYLGDGLGSVQYTLQSSDTGFGTIDFGDVSDSNIGRLSYNHNDNSFLIRTNNVTALTLDASQNATFTGDMYLGTDSDILKSGTNPFRLYTNGTLALSVSASQNATFTGTVGASNLSGTNTGDQDLSGYLLNTTDTFTGVLTIESTGSTTLRLKDTNSVGNAASPYINFEDSAGTRVGYVGMGSIGNSILYLEGLGGVRSNNDFSSAGTITGTNLSGTNTGDQDLSGYLLNTTDTLTGTLTVAGKLDISGASANAATITTSGFTNLDLVSGRTSGNLGGIRFKQDLDSFQTGEFNSLYGGGFDWKVGDGTATPTVLMSLDSSGNISATNLSGTNTGDQTLTGLDYAATSHSHNDLYYTETESDAKYLLNTTDTLTGTLSISSAAIPLKFEETGYTGQGKHWRQVVDSGNLRFDSCTTGDGGFTPYDSFSVSKSGNISATNLSGTNTGDQDLSSYITTSTADGKYLLNTTDTLNGSLTVSSSQGVRNTSFISAGNGGWVQYESGNDGIYGYIGSGSHLLAPVVNDNDFVVRAENEFVVSIQATEKFRINSSGNATFKNTQTAESLLTLDNTRNDLGSVPFYGIAGNSGGSTVAKVSFNRGSGSNSGFLTFDTKLDNATAISTKMTLSGSGNLNVVGDITANNLSGTNTGDQDLSSYITTSTADGKYLLNTTDTLTGELTVTNGTYGLKSTYSVGNASGILDTAGNHDMEFRRNNSKWLSVNSALVSTFSGDVIVKDGFNAYGANAIAAPDGSGLYCATFGKSVSGSASFEGNITVGAGNSTFGGDLTVTGMGNFSDAIESMGSNEHLYGGEVAFDAFPGETASGIRVLATDEYVMPFLGAPHIEGQGNLGAGSINSRAGISTYIETAKYNFTTNDQTPYGVLWMRRAGKAMTSIIAKSKSEASSHISSRLKVGYTPSDNYGDQTDMNTLSVYGNTHSEEVVSTDATRAEIETKGSTALVTIDYLNTGSTASPDVKFGRVFGYGNTSASGNHFIASYDGKVMANEGTHTLFNGSDSIEGQGNLGFASYAGVELYNTTRTLYNNNNDQIPAGQIIALKEGVARIVLTAHEKADGASGINSRLQIGYSGTPDQTNTDTLAVNGNVKADSFVKDGGTSSQFLMADGSVTSGIPVMSKVKVTLTSAQILNLFTTPIEIVPAPGIGKLVSVISATVRLNYNTIAYVSSGSFGLKYLSPASGTVSFQNSFLESTATKILSGAANTPVDAGENTSIVTNMLSANPTTGNSTVDIYVTYETITL